MHRFYVNQVLSLGEQTIEGLHIVHQLVKVLRLKPGETVIFFDGSGNDFYARIIFYAKSSLRVEVFEKKENQRELSLTITLCHAIIKKERMEWLFEKAAEVGVSEFLPLLTERVVPKELQIGRGQKIIKEAAEQSGRALIPELREPVRLERAIAECLTHSALGVFLHPERRFRRSMPELQQKLLGKKRVYIFIGPEGGFTDDEVSAAENAGMLVASLYPTVLRAETAGVVFPALIGAMIV